MQKDKNNKKNEPIEPDQIIIDEIEKKSTKKDEVNSKINPKLIAIITASISAIYLLNFTMGVVEIPDMIPVIGNLDEAAATALLLGSLKYLGWDIDVFKKLLDKFYKK